MWKLIRILLAIAFAPLLIDILFLCNIMQMASLLILPFSGALFRQVNRGCSFVFYFSLVFLLKGILRIQFVRTGEKLPAKENAFVFANHQSMADIPTLLTEALPAGRLGDLKWFVKDPLKWVPGIGWGLLFLDCLFVKRNWMADQEKILATFNRLRTHASPFWVLSFLEGTRATTKKLEQSREFERKNQLPELTYVLSPRTKGFLATLAGLGSLTQAVYDFTIAYEGMKPGKVPGLLALFFGPIERIHVHVKRFPIGEIPLDEHARAQWVQQRFVEKDKLLARFHETGVLR